MSASSANVLVVDDDPSVRIIARTVLSKSGFTVLEADGGDQAMAHLAQVGSDLRLVLLDYSMPGKDGREVYWDLVAAGCSAPVVICTGHELQMDEFRTPSGQIPQKLLKKPYDFAALITTVQAA